jgi:hypothetical protein
MRPLLPEEWTSNVEKRAREEFEKQLTEHIGYLMRIIFNSSQTMKWKSPLD